MEFILSLQWVKINFERAFLFIYLCIFTKHWYLFITCNDTILLSTWIILALLKYPRFIKMILHILPQGVNPWWYFWPIARKFDLEKRRLEKRLHNKKKYLCPVLSFFLHYHKNLKCLNDSESGKKIQNEINVPMNKWTFDYYPDLTGSKIWIRNKDDSKEGKKYALRLMSEWMSELWF